jgi:Cu-Zn family superoxide dismutase
MRSSLLASCALLLGACVGLQPEGPTAVAVVRPISGSQVHGEVKFTQVVTSVRVNVELAALTPGMHGMHIHETGDCSSADGMSAGGHFNPRSLKHGAPDTTDRHAGDLGNVIADEYGKATVELILEGLNVTRGAEGIVGRAVIVHANADDLKTDPAGNSGARLGCGVIE